MSDVLLPERLRELHLFAGIGGGILGGMLLGHAAVCAVEIEPYCRKVLLQRQRDGILPKFPIWDDIKTFDGKPWRGLVDVVCGGFPCQDISVAGNGAGISGARSGLWKHMARVIGEVQPRYVFVENSPLLVSRGIGMVLGDLVRLGFDARWGIFSASAAGFMHKRERVFIHANSNKTNATRIPTDTRIKNITKTKRTNTKNRKDWRGRMHELEAMDVVSRADSYSEGRRICNGIPNGLDRFNGIGNAQVPSVAALAWQTLSDL